MTGRANWARPAAINESARAPPRAASVSCPISLPPPLTSTSNRASIEVLRFGPQVTAHLDEELPLRGREALDAGRRDLVEHTVDLSVRPSVARGGRVGLRLWRAAAPTSSSPSSRHRRNQDARLRDAPQMPLRPSQAQILPLEIQEPGDHAAEVGEMRHATTAAAEPGRREEQGDREREGH